MKAMIMAAGVGSRLMPLTVEVPKPMIPMANRPLMESIVNLLKEHQFDDVIANLHYHAETISDYFGNGEAYGLSLQYSLEEELKGTAGGVKNCENFLNETFVVVSGDALTDIDLTALMRAHRSNGALATIALKKVDDVEQFGVVVHNDAGKIKKFQEKPKQEEALSNMANTGIYIFEPEIFKYIPPRQFYDFGKQVFPHLVRIKAPFYGTPIEDYWCDVGNINTYRQAHKDILAGRVRTKTERIMINGASDAKVLCGENTMIGKGVTFSGNIVIGSGCIIQDGARISNCIIWDDTVVGKNSLLRDCVVGSSCNIGEQVIIETGAVVASRCQLEDKVDIKAGQKVFVNTSGLLQLEQG
ncbi:MAG TPA: NDP-sugar synthase [Syntrophomonadaceae bacterium]|jgi:mannose-1-phosphate guanylyltransferase|nr:NDP-sugar synthase [Syntrophomonadaceae bacterium]HRX20716.1 NDP-sugar synthase [Syntrophomonadaceae bacterium]